MNIAVHLNNALQAEMIEKGPRYVAAPRDELVPWGAPALRSGGRRTHYMLTPSYEGLGFNPARSPWFRTELQVAS